MGNKYSTDDKPYVVVQKQGNRDYRDYRDDFYGKRKEDYPSIDDYYYHGKAEEIYNRVQRQVPLRSSLRESSSLHDEFSQVPFRQEPDIYVERRIEIFIDPERGLTMPYKTGRTDFENISSDKNPEVFSSENPRYIEFIICKGDLGDLNEKFAVHKSNPDHECKGDCSCIKELIVVDPQTNKIIQRTSRPYDISPTSSPSPYQKEKGKTCPFMLGGNGRTRYNTNKGWSSTTTDSSPEEISDSDEINDRLFSATSDLDNEMSPTDTTSAKNKKQTNKQNYNKQNKKLTQEKETDLDEEFNLDEDDDEEAFIGDEGDDIEEELEGIEDEDITEDGIILSQSDITSSDLYRMQNRIFRSDTETDFDDDNDDELTDKIRSMMSNMNSNNTGNRNRNERNRNKRSGLFDTEEKEMLDMDSDTDRNELSKANKMNEDTSSDRYTKKSTRKNNKYN